MLTFLHSFSPQPVLYALGPIKIYWYGLFIVLGIVSAMLAASRLARRQEISPEAIFDLFFYLVLGGLVGARLYNSLLNWSYYSGRPLDILKIWQGGLAVHGAIIGCAVVLVWFTRRRKLDVWQLSALVATVAPLAQAIGRWGNYFNQELFGRPTSLPWGIPIDLANRPATYLDYQYFHPTFLYESVGNLIIFFVLIFIYKKIVSRAENAPKFSIFPAEAGPRQGGDNFQFSIIFYLISYSILRFILEFIKIDPTPEFLGLRWPQWMSLIIIVISLSILFFAYKKRGLNNAQIPANIK